MYSFTQKFLTIAVCWLPLLAFGQCDELRKKVDKFNNDVTISTPLLKGNQLEPVRFMRVSKGNETFTFLRLTANAALSGPRKGVFVLFDDGTKLEWPEEKVQFDYLYSYFAYCFIRLTDDDIRQLRQKTITDFKLHVYDRTLTKKQGNRARDFIDCLSSINPNDVKQEK